MRLCHLPLSPLPPHAAAAAAKSPACSCALFSRTDHQPFLPLCKVALCGCNCCPCTGTCSAASAYLRLCCTTVPIVQARVLLLLLVRQLRRGPLVRMSTGWYACGCNEALAARGTIGRWMACALPPWSIGSHMDPRVMLCLGCFQGNQLMFGGSWLFCVPGAEAVCVQRC